MKKDIAVPALCMTTLFERILLGEIPSHEVAKGDGWYAFLDIFPRREGHTLVIPTRPVQRLAELTPEEGAQLMSGICLLYTSPSPRDGTKSRMPSSA